jgi:hypothetical protein
METIFVTIDVLNSLQIECISFLGSFAKTCMIFGILRNKILLINVFSVFFPISKFRLPTIFLAQNSGFYGFFKNET